jgi:hypothetical protein
MTPSTDSAPGPAPHSPGTGPGARGGGFAAELRDAVRVRAALLIVGVLALQLAFVASYIGAFHEPRPRSVPLAVTAASPGVAAETARLLSGLGGDPLDASVSPDEAAARERLAEREVDGVLVVTPGGRPDRLLVAGASGASLAQAVTATVTAAERARGRAVVTEDVIPSSAGDARGLSSFYLAIGWCVGGYLCAAALAISAGARPANPERALIRLGVLLVYSVVAGLLGAVIAGPVLDALPGPVAALWGLGTLLVFAVGATTLALQGLAGIIGVGLAILLVVVLGNPSAGGAYPYPLLPPFWEALGPALPPGAGTWSARSIAYFDGEALTGPLLVLSAWAVGGALVALACALVRRRRADGPGPRGPVG